MLIKKKSLLVALVSSVVIALVMILTLAGYFLYLEFKAEEFRRHYQELYSRPRRAYIRNMWISENLTPE